MRDKGYCECGCGGKTSLAPQTHRAKGWVKGEPIRFIKGHSGHKYAPGETTIAERWSVEDRGYDTPCWVWQLHRSEDGYGKIMADHRCQAAHRYYFEQAHGRVPRGMHLDHLCRVRACVNPDHLEVVTHAENCRRGANAKLSPPQVLEIRRRAALGESYRELSERFGVTSVQIGNVVTRKSWSNL